MKMRMTPRKLAVTLSVIGMMLPASPGFAIAADNTTFSTARSIAVNATFQDSLQGTVRPEIWYKTQLFAGRSYQISVWSVKEDGAAVSIGPVELYTDPMMPSLVTVGVTSTGGVFEGSPNNESGGPQTTVFQPTATGLYLIKATTTDAMMPSVKVNVRVRETTLFSPWTSRAAGFEGFMEIHNNTSAALSVTLSAYNNLGVLQGTGLTFPVPANATVFQTATGIGVPLNTFAGIVLTHNGAFGAVSGNITTLNGVNGLSFDSPFTPRDFGGGDGGGDAGAASGANSDITSLSGLTTPLSIPQGGTGATTAAAGRMALGAAAAGANADITSLSGLSTPLLIAQGGTGASTQNFVDLTTNQGVGGIKTFSGANTFTTTQTVSTGNAAAKGVIVKGAASQTANLLELQNSASTVLSSIGPSGIFNGNISGSAANATTVGGLTCTNGQVAKWSGSVWTCGTDVGGSGTVTGVTASAPLSSSGGVIPDVSLTGTVAVTNGGTGAATAGAARTSLAVPGLAGNNAYSGTQTLVPATNALQPLVVQGLASQSANLQEWKNSAAATLASVGPTGLVTAGGFSTAGSISAGSLTGLSTPLSVAQGGTGSATQNFVDLSTTQTVAGIKTFSSPIVGSISGSAGTVPDGAITAAKLASNGCGSGQVLQFNGSAWLCSTVGVQTGCSASDLLPCYSGPAATLGVGVCRSGNRLCNVPTSTFGACTGQVLPAAEILDGADNNCDGFPDNLPGTSLLSLIKAGDGTGTVTSLPAGINCGVDCTEPYITGTSVTLTATPFVGSTFTGWSGGSCSGTGTCVLSVAAPTAVTATFTLTSFTLTAAKAGIGTVTSVPAGISCGGDCSEVYGAGTPVTLIAAPSAGWTFSGWSGGGCSTGLCALTLGAATSVTATFAQSLYALTAAKTGAGIGTVTSSPAAINCGPTCVASLASGTVVTLTATSFAGSTFTGWSGAGCSGFGTCVVTLNQPETVAASFAPVQRTLTITKSGPNAPLGTVTPLPAGINCGSGCFAYDDGTVVVLTATVLAGTFTGWSGCSSQSGFLCVVTMNSTQNVNASFNP